jgi:Ca2+-binding EF-hand superfamily protein
MKKVLLHTLLLSSALISTLRAADPASEALASLIFKEFDTNSDDIIDSGEWQGGIQASFEDMDVNADGSIALNEVETLSSDIANETGELVAGLVVLFIKQVVMSLDENKDKLVGRAEFDHLSSDLFNKLDGDKNGSLSREEVAVLPEKLAGTQSKSND